MDVLSRFPLAVAVGTQPSVAIITMISSQKTVKVIYYFTFMLYSLFCLTAIYLIKLKKEVYINKPSINVETRVHISYLCILQDPPAVLRTFRSAPLIELL